MSELGFPTPLCGLYTSRPARVSHVVRWIWMNGRDQGGARAALLGRFQQPARPLVFGPRAHLSLRPLH
jgi:hypothetical protein